MSFRTYRDIIRDSIIGLGGRGTVFEIYEFIENNYPDFIKEKDPKSWRNTIRFNLWKGNFHQLEDDRAMSIDIQGGTCKYWYNNDSDNIQTHEERLQQKFEEALKFIHSNKDFQDIMLHFYLKI